MRGERLLTVISVVGVLTFFFANLIGMKQKDEKRMLGYSSTGQVGLALFAWTVSRFAGIPESSVLLIVGGFLLTHMFAKAGLFWLAGISGDSAETKNHAFRADFRRRDGGFVCHGPPGTSPLPVVLCQMGTGENSHHRRTLVAVGCGVPRVSF
jgi:NADH:ubiquinone oxidoreductase subunit 5 (subunit L)/multisubunit Na+/H+ antiporter MnhA subunit